MTAAAEDLVVDSSKVFALGNFRFKLTNYSHREAEQIEKLFPLAAENDASQSECETLAIGTQERGAVRPIINKALRHHENCIWIAAALLLSPSGKLFLFAGQSCSGKSTLAAALAFGHDWAVIAEDICLIEREHKAFIPFISPMSMKTGTVERIEAVVGNTIPQPLLGEWIPLQSKAVAPNLVPGKIDFVFALESAFEPQAPAKPLSIRKVSVEQILIELLKLSNILHLEDPPDVFIDYVNSARCFRINGGELSERLDFVIELSRPDG